MFKDIDDTILEFYLAALDTFDSDLAMRYRRELNKVHDESSEFQKDLVQKRAELERDIEKMMKEVVNV